MAEQTRNILHTIEDWHTSLEKSYKYNLGGAGNLIMNLKNLKVKFKFFCHVGNDKSGKHIESLLKKNNFVYYLKKINQPTTIKTRFVNTM